MIGQYLPLLALFVLAALFAAGSLLVSGWLAPRNSTASKRAPYECGIVPTRETPERFPVRFFLVAMIFVVFDIEIVFFYPWAIAQGGLGIFGLVLIMIFSFAVFESFVYLIGNGALEWGPLKRAAAQQDTASSERTVTSTIRRVGLEDRGPAALASHVATAATATTSKVAPEDSGEAP